MIPKHLKYLEYIHLIMPHIFIKDPPLLLLLKHLSSPRCISYHFLIDLLLTICIIYLLVIEPILADSLGIHNIVLLEYLAIAAIHEVAGAAHVSHTANEVVSSFFEG